MGALAVSQLLENAQDKGVEIALETAAVENQVSSYSSLNLRVVPTSFFPEMSRICLRV